MFGVTGDFKKGFCAGAEQQIVEHLLVLQHELGELLGQGKDDMDVGHCQKLVLASCDPLIADAVLTLRAKSGELVESITSKENGWQDSSFATMKSSVRSRLAPPFLKRLTVNSAGFAVFDPAEPCRLNGFRHLAFWNQKRSPWLASW